MKTRDGVKLENVLAAVKQIPGIEVRTGTKHPFILLWGDLRPCPLAESTDIEKMVLPWLRQTMTNYNKMIAYNCLKTGSMENYYKTFET